MNNAQQQYAYDRESGERVMPGEDMISFRGEGWTLMSVSRRSEGSSEGRVTARRICSSAYATGGLNGGIECPHMWHRDGMNVQEFFPSVFGLQVRSASEVTA